jgi:enterochelin esterase family protein
MRVLLSFAALLVAGALPAQTIDSHQVNADNSITFRYQNGSASAVLVATDAAMRPLPMTKDEKGLWTVSTGALPPEIYSYSFVVDGVQELDPLNNQVVPNILARSNSLLVPGHPPKPWELTAIPHGAVTRHMLTTHIALNLPANQEPYIVYTPPGYDAHKKGGYPVLYLLHGFSDSANGWTQVGKANLIFDSMLASGSIVPMIVVMPMGYGNFDFVTDGGTGWNDPAKVDENVTLYSQMLENEVMPAVEHEYNIAHGRENHAIAGLSMGGLESLTIGLKDSRQFAWVGGFSSAVADRHYDEHFPGLTAKKADLRLLWVACGTSDSAHLFQPNQDFIAWAKAKSLPVTAIETPGQHTWLVWRDNLLHFAPLLFR